MLRGTGDLNASTAEQRDDQSGDKSCVETLFRFRPGRDRECHRERKCHDSTTMPAGELRPIASRRNRPARQASMIEGMWLQGD